MRSTGCLGCQGSDLLHGASKHRSLLGTTSPYRTSSVQNRTAPKSPTNTACLMIRGDLLKVAIYIRSIAYTMPEIDEPLKAMQCYVAMPAIPDDRTLIAHQSCTCGVAKAERNSLPAGKSLLSHPKPPQLILKATARTPRN